jgi:hypothetical protein
MFEVTADGEIVWEYWDPYSGDGKIPEIANLKKNNPHAVFRVTKIPFDHPALAGRELSPLDPQPQPIATQAK